MSQEQELGCAELEFQSLLEEEEEEEETPTSHTLKDWHFLCVDVILRQKF